MTCSINNEYLGTTTEIWDSPCFKYTLISVIALAAITCLVIGAVACSEVALKEMGKSWSGVLMAAGSLVLGGETGFILTYCYDLYKKKQGAISYDKYLLHKDKLKQDEFSVVYDFKGCEKGQIGYGQK